MLIYQFVKNWEPVLFRKHVTPAHNTDHYFKTTHSLDNLRLKTFRKRVVVDADTIGFRDEALVLSLENKTFMNKGVYNVSDDTKIDQIF